METRVGGVDGVVVERVVMTILLLQTYHTASWVNVSLRRHDDGNRDDEYMSY